jgi:uridylate kinase
MDAAAVDILARNGIRGIVLNLHEEANISRALAGEHVGTLIV